jgi:hypothetical protein
LCDAIIKVVETSATISPVDKRAIIAALERAKAD